MTQPTPPDNTALDAGGDKRDLLHDRRALAVIGGGLVVVAAVGFFVVKPALGGSSSDSSTGTVANAHVHHASTASASPSVSATPAAAPTPAPKLVIRDPFSPLYVAPSAASSSSASAAPSAASTAPVAQVSAVIVPVPGPTVTKTVAPTAKYTLTLEAVSPSLTAADQKATIMLNGVSKTVRYKVPFGPFTLLSVSPPDTAPQNETATFMYSGNSFTVHVRDTEYDY